MEKIAAVADTGPLIALAQTDLLDLLEQLFGEVMIPDAVRIELLAKHSNESRRIECVLSTFLKMVNPSSRSHSVGVIVLAKQSGYVDAVLPIVREMRRNGYWLSHELLRQAAALANEELE